MASSALAQPSNEQRSRSRPLLPGWQWASWNPGLSSRPARSTTRVPGPIDSETLASSPTAVISSPVTAKALANDRAGPAVKTGPLMKTRSAGMENHSGAPIPDYGTGSARQNGMSGPPLASSTMSAFWHPFAEMSKVQHAPFIVDRGEGIYVYDETGRGYLDAAASLWYMNVGYGRTEIIDAMAEQMRKLPAFHAFIDYGTRPAIDLADRIASVSPDPGSKVFFGSGGSDAVDTAAKMTRRYFNAMGQPERTVFISREWAYHGMHPYGTSLGGMEPNRAGYGGDLVTDIVIVPHDDAEAVEKAIDHAGAERIAGIFVEPVIGAGGVRPVEESYFGAVQELVRNAGGLYVSDEVITGFGRVGDWFAANKY